MDIANGIRGQGFKETAAYKIYMAETGAEKAKRFLPGILGAWTVWNMGYMSLQQRYTIPHLIGETAISFGIEADGERFVNAAIRSVQGAANSTPAANKVSGVAFGKRWGLARAKNSLNEKSERGVEMTVINKNINDLIPYANNPRKNGAAVDKVAASIKEFGFKVPIIIDRGNVIVTGHTRLLAAKKLGLETVPCVIADDLTPAQIKAFRIADNKTAEFSEWDDDMLKVELEESLHMTGATLICFVTNAIKMSMSALSDEKLKKQYGGKKNKNNAEIGHTLCYGEMHIYCLQKMETIIKMIKPNFYCSNIVYSNVIMCYNNTARNIDLL